MSSGLWAPVGPPLNLGLMEYVHIQTIVPLSVYSSTQWWGKVVAGVIYSVHLFHLHQPLQAPRTSLHPFCRLHAICQAVFWGWLCLSLLKAFETIALYHWRNFPVNILSCSWSIWWCLLSQVGIKLCQKMDRHFSHEWDHSSFSCSASEPLAYPPFWCQCVECRV